MLPTMLLLCLSSQAELERGKVTLPVRTWDAMVAEREAQKRRFRPDVPVAAIDREIQGSFRKGLLKARLVVRFVVLGPSEDHLRVPVIDGNATIGEALLDGMRTSLLREGSLYTVGVDRPGRHELSVELYWGKELDRYTRRIKLALPPGGPTKVRILVPEQDIEPHLASGAITSAREAGGGTEIEGQLDASGNLDLSWARRLSHEGGAAVRTEARLDAVLTIKEAVVSGLAMFEVSVLEGETDRIDLLLPEGMEVVEVEGDPVLQWRTDPGPKSRLTVLLRYLAEEQVRFAVRFQLPIDPSKPFEVKLPSTSADVPLSGVAGIRAPAGLEVKIEEIQGAEVLNARDIPEELSDLSSSPLLHAFRFDGAPRVKLSVSRQQDVELTSTLVDDIQASTVLIENGLEVTKLKLRIRNNTRQYLTVHLPREAVLTHSLIDGQPVRPAISPEDPAALLLPLRQSERIGDGTSREHVVGEGETLSDIANFYYSDPTDWQLVFRANQDRLADATDIQVGQTLLIPAKRGAVVEESSFVIELAYKRPRASLGPFGAAGIELPAIDVDTVAVTWHVYLPSAIVPLGFRANLTQYSNLRYDPFRRLRDFIDLAFGVQSAWAGEARYKNILTQRKVIWQAETEKRGGSEALVSSFPLVGERWRFKRILLGRETPRVAFLFVRDGLTSWVRWAALALAIAAGMLLFGLKRTNKSITLGVIALLLLLVAGHFFLGVHRRILWGFDLALLAVVARPYAGIVRDRLAAIARAPWLAGRLFTIRGLAALIALYVLLQAVLSFPLLLSSAGLVALLFFRWRASRLEVRHA
jgi:hypothetical protein